MEAGRREHVRLFFTTRKSAEAEQDVARRLASLKATLERWGLLFSHVDWGHN